MNPIHALLFCPIRLIHLIGRKSPRFEKKLEWLFFSNNHDSSGASITLLVHVKLIQLLHDHDRDTKKFREKATFKK